MDTSDPPVAGAPAPSASNPSPPSAPREEKTAEERLQLLKEKTNAWKAAAAEQLKEAAAKNKALREELKATRERAEQDLVELRVQLNKEFKERTVMLQDEVTALNTQVATLRKEKTELAATHAADLQAVEARGKEAGRLEAEKGLHAAEERHRAEVSRLTAAVEAKDREVSQAEHEASLLSARLERLGEQYAELSALIGSDTATNGTKGDGTSGYAGGGSAADGGLALAVNDAAHQQQLESVRAELVGKEQQMQRRLEAAKIQHEQERQQIIREVQAREERLAVLQELLRQSQNELSTSQQRISHAQADTQRLEQHYAAKVSSLSHELANQLETLEAAQQRTAELERQVKLAQETIASLEEDATSREEAFHALMLSEDDKQLVRSLEAATQAAREEAEDWRLKYYTLQREVKKRQRPARNPAAPGSVEATHEQQALEALDGEDDDQDTDEKAALLKVQARESEVAAREAQLEERAQALRVAEVKLNEIKKSVAQQASMILSQSTNLNNGGKRSSGVPSNGAGEGSGGTAPGGAASGNGGRWVSALRRPALYFDALSEEQSWPRWCAHTMRWVLATRMRMLLFVSCVLVVTVLLANMMASVKASAQSNDVLV